MSNGATAVRASDFINSIGVDTHFSYYNTAYANLGQALSDLSYLGVSHVRDVVVPVGVDYVSTYEQAMAAGIRFDSVIPVNMLDVPTDVAIMSQLATAYPGGIEAVEGINESSPTFGYAGLSGNAAANAFQSVLYKAVKASPVLSGVQVYNYTVGTNPYDPASYTQFSGTPPQYTQANAHLYFGGSAPDTANWFLAEELGGSHGLPYVVTETGYDTMPGTDTDGSQGVNQDVQARYTLDDIFDLLSGGATKAYVYELLDEFADPGFTSHEQHLGLFNNDGTPKPAATALHNLTTTLADGAGTAATYKTGTLGYSLSGLPASGQSMLLEKSNASFDLAVWAQPAIWNTTTLLQTAPTPVPVVLKLDQLAGSVEVYDPLVGTAPIQRYGEVDQITLSITDHPLIVEIDPIVVATLSTSATRLALAVAENLTITGSRDTVSSGSAHLGVVDIHGRNTIMGGLGGIDARIGAQRDVIGTAAGGVDTIELDASGNQVTSRGQDTITMSANAGSNTVQALGSATITGSQGANQVSLQGQDVFDSMGRDGVWLSGGNSTISATGASITVVQTGGRLVLDENGGGVGQAITISGQAIVTAGAGRASLVATTMASTGSQMVLGSGNSVVTSLGADSIVAGTGADTIHAMGSASIAGGSGSIVLDMHGAANTFVAGSGMATITQGVGTSALTFGAGSTTAHGGAGVDTYTALQGSGGGQDVVYDFRVGIDHLLAAGFAANPIAGQQVLGGNLVVTLSDHSRITLMGVQHTLMGLG